MKYPDAERLPLVENLHGHFVPDPYRRLEDPADPATRAWQAAQDELWRRHAARLPLREHFRERLAALSDTGTSTPPVWRGERRFHLARSAGQEHPVLYCDDRVLLDPMALDPTGLTTLDDWQPDRSGRLLAYQLSRSGDERANLYVMDVGTGERVDGPIGGCRYSPVAWLADGFFYVRFHQGVHLRRNGRDVPVLSRGALSYGLQTSADGRWLVISAGTPARNDLYLADVSGGLPGRLRVVQEGVDARTAAAVGPDGRLYVVTDRDAPRRRLCVADPADPGRWKDLVPEDPEAVLGAFALLDGGRLLVARTRHAVGEIAVHDAATGGRLGMVPLPGSGSVASLISRPGGGHEAWFAYTDAVTPAEVWRYDARTGTTTRWPANGGTDPADDGSAPSDGRTGSANGRTGTSGGRAGGTPVESHHLTCTSADGTPVRMVVVARPHPGGPRPAILTGYGGFGMSLTPGYAADSLAWVEAGGVLAVANLRGGGEEGERWHRDGMLDRKQNVFDDFTAAAAKLVADGWTTPGRLAVWGESNGGLLVGAALTRRPELFAAVVCSAGLLDMVRYERSGLGASWTGEYGSASDPRQLGWLLGYSPYHHVRAEIDYPATLFTVSAADSRVDPMHARKMCAALQWATAGKRPVLLRHERDVGHGARAVSRSIELAADVLAFAAAHTGLTPPAC
ncbi:prolyl oligopeptidase family serine peptidase [Nonomuraea rhizosphaerae]|uniref:prolyl oligopeptidase family serine peptidase n=1 Tax=Nonomuraea rhizosphaerae TaxID=2665663 RepID=UPI001C5D7853|nr:prolyl oligopeptidase family serine peptidase [Nonomuraea rhizosphaerae]